MATIKIVDNPRRKKRRRTYTAKQRAAGFGGKRSMRRRRSTKRRRSNPAMLSMGNPTRRRRSYRRSASRSTYRRRRMRSRSNPSLFGFNFDLKSAAYIGTGVLAVEIVPKLGKRFWPGMPTTGLTGTLVKAGSAILAGTAVGYIFKNRQAGALITTGGLAVVLVDLFRQHVMPSLPFMAGYVSSGPVTAGQISDAFPGVSEYVPTPNRLSGYVNNPVGAY